MFEYYDHAWGKSDGSLRPIGAVAPIRRLSRKKKKRKKREDDAPQKQRLKSDDPRRHLRELELAIEEFNEELEEQESHFRFAISLKEKQLVLLVYRETTPGAMKLITGRNITKEDFLEVAMEITEGRGLLLDLDG